MVEAVMVWNEPNNLSHWDFELDPDWSIFTRMLKTAWQAIRAERASVARVLGRDLADRSGVHRESP